MIGEVIARRSATQSARTEPIEVSIKFGGGQELILKNAPGIVYYEDYVLVEGGSTISLTGGCRDFKAGRGTFLLEGHGGKEVRIRGEVAFYEAGDTRNIRGAVAFYEAGDLNC